MKRGQTRRTFLSGSAVAPIIVRDLVHSAKAKERGEVVGCSIVLRVKDDRPVLHAPEHDARRLCRGEVDDVLGLNGPWGELPLGGPFYTHYEAVKVYRNRNAGERAAGIEKPFDWVHKFVERRHVSQHPNGNHNFWRIIRLPNVRRVVAEMLTQSEMPKFDNYPKSFLQRREFYLDIAALPADMQPFLDDDERKVQVFTSQMTTAEFKNCVCQRAPLIGVLA